MIESMQQAAVKAIEEHELMKLSTTERQTLVKLLLNPPAPNEALQLATRRYHKMAGC
jgi:uncharacterized protein (DUF1778 family)